MHGQRADAAPVVRAPPSFAVAAVVNFGPADQEEAFGHVWEYARMRRSGLFLHAAVTALIVLHAPGAAQNGLYGIFRRPFIMRRHARESNRLPKERSVVVAAVFVAVIVRRGGCCRVYVTSTCAVACVRLAGIQ